MKGKNGLPQCRLILTPYKRSLLKDGMSLMRKSSRQRIPFISKGMGLRSPRRHLSLRKKGPEGLLGAGPANWVWTAALMWAVSSASGFYAHAAHADAATMISQDQNKGELYGRCDPEMMVAEGGISIGG